MSPKVPVLGYMDEVADSNPGVQPSSNGTHTVSNTVSEKTGMNKPSTNKVTPPTTSVYPVRRDPSKNSTGSRSYPRTPSYSRRKDVSPTSDNSRRNRSPTKTSRVYGSNSYRNTPVYPSKPRCRNSSPTRNTKGNYNVNGIVRTNTSRKAIPYNSEVVNPYAPVDSKNEATKSPGNCLVRVYTPSGTKSPNGRNVSPDDRPSVTRHEAHEPPTSRNKARPGAHPNNNVPPRSTTRTGKNNISSGNLRRSPSSCRKLLPVKTTNRPTYTVARPSESSSVSYYVNVGPSMESPNASSRKSYPLLLTTKPKHSN